MSNDILRSLKLQKNNYKGNTVMVVGGVIIIFFTTILLFFLYSSKLISYKIFSELLFVNLLVGATGFLDDMVGNKDSHGLKGHFLSLKNGKLTTGILKVIIILLAAIFIVSNWGNISFLEKLINIGLLVLMSNFMNLLDLRPGRSIKFFLIFSFFLINKRNLFYYLLPYYFTIIIYLPYELNGKLMLGDSGANILGFILAYNLLLYLDNIYHKVFFLLVFLLMTLLSEKYSFTEIIKGNKILNWIDQLGRNE